MCGLKDGGRIPRQQLVDPVGRVLCNVGERVAQVGFGIDAVKLGA